MADSSRAYARRILAINTGSSSLKAGLFLIDRDELSRRGTFTVERIGSDASRRSIALANEKPTTETEWIPEHADALNWVFEKMRERGWLAELLAVGHRIVHGGAHHSAPELVSDALVSDLRALFPIDPEHLPQAVSAIEAVTKQLPDVPQIACFDTHFHDTMPKVAQLLPLPRSLFDEGVRRFGFHGLSYESIMTQLKRVDPDAASGKIVIAHLGAGASMVAAENGKSVETTMGFTPTGGLMMGTRTGDLDPGVLLFLLQVRKLTAVQINRLLNKESGLLGVSGSGQDMRDLLAAEQKEPYAAEAVALFCHLAKKQLGALIAALGGLGGLVFTGGIGEHAAPVRARICADLEFVGIMIDPDRNAANEAVISTAGSAVTVRVMHTDEEFAVARHAARLIAIEGNSHVAF
jgi:acetate kinase